MPTAIMPARATRTTSPPRTRAKCCARALVAIRLQTVRYGEPLTINGVRVSLHPAGHVLGSAQVRIEHGGSTWVVSGDYKTGPDATCAAFEPVRCDVFVSESTFGLPIYRWSPQEEVFAEINGWWAGNAAEARTSVLYLLRLRQGAAHP